MNKLKLALVSPFPPSKGTLNEYAYHLVAQFRQKTALEEIVILSDQLPEGSTFELPAGPVPVRCEQTWAFNDWGNLFRILRAVRRERPDVVLFNVHFLSFGDQKIPAALGLLTPMLCRLLGARSVVLLHNLTETVDLSSAGITQNRVLQTLFGWIGTLLTFFLLQADLLGVTISKYVDILETKYGADNVALLPHGTFELAALPDFTLPAGPRRVMAFGKFGTYKKVEAMIEAVEKIRARTAHDIEIVIAGSDSPNAAGYLADVAARYAHVPQLRFTGYVAEEAVPRLFGDSAVAVFPYTSTTGSSGVLHQAGSYGCACALPNIGDLKALVEEEGYSGAFFDPHCGDSLADALQGILDDEPYRVALARQNFAASAGLPLSDIADWYLLHFERLAYGTAPEAVPAKAVWPTLQTA